MLNLLRVPVTLLKNFLRHHNFLCYTFLHVVTGVLFFKEIFVSDLDPSESVIVVKALTLLAATMRRSAKAATSDEVAAIYERDAARVEALANRFR